MLDGAVTASKVSQCGKKLKAAKRRAQTYAIRVGRLTSKGCLAPFDRAASLLAQAQELAMRAGTLARSAYCAQR